MGPGAVIVVSPLLSDAGPIATIVPKAMARARKGEKRANSTGATIGYEARLWQMADALRNNTDAAEHKHVVIGLLCLKYIPSWGGRRPGRRQPQGHGPCPERVCP